MEQYLQPFIDVTKSTFKNFIGADLKVGNPYFMNKNAASEWDISGVIGLSGEARGAVVIGMKNDLAIQLTCMLTGSKQNSINEEVMDAIGEIVNIISGNAKKGLEDIFKLIISLPIIINGPDHRIEWPHRQSRIICVPFIVFNSESLLLSVAIESRK